MQFCTALNICSFAQVIVITRHLEIFTHQFTYNTSDPADFAKALTGCTRSWAAQFQLTQIHSSLSKHSRPSKVSVRLEPFLLALQWWNWPKASRCPLYSDCVSRFSHPPHPFFCLIWPMQTRPALKPRPQRHLQAPRPSLTVCLSSAALTTFLTLPQANTRTLTHPPLTRGPTPPLRKLPFSDWYVSVIRRKRKCYKTGTFTHNRNKGICLTLRELHKDGECTYYPTLILRGIHLNGTQ